MSKHTVTLNCVLSGRECGEVSRREGYPDPVKDPAWNCDSHGVEVKLPESEAIGTARRLLFGQTLVAVNEGTAVV